MGKRIWKTISRSRTFHYKLLRCSLTKETRHSTSIPSHFLALLLSCTKPRHCKLISVNNFMTCPPVSGGGECLNIIVDFIHFCIRAETVDGPKKWCQLMIAIKNNFYRRHDRIEQSRARKQGQIGAKATLEIKERKIIVIFMTRCCALSADWKWHAALSLLLFRLTVIWMNVLFYSILFLSCREAIIKGRWSLTSITC